MEERRLKGVSLSEGFAIGIPFFFVPQETKIPEFSISLKEVNGEIARYRSALFSSREDLKQMQSHLLGEASSIIESHIHMLEDPLITEGIEEGIRQRLQNPEAVFHSVISDYEKRFSQRAGSFFQERLTDVMDLAQRVLGHLNPSKGSSLEQVPFNSIVFTQELLPSHIVSVKGERICAFVTQRGGRHSHAALMARAKGIPYVASIDIGEQMAIHSVIVDGEKGEVILNPTPSTLGLYTERVASFNAPSQEELDLPLDECAVYVNVGHVEELKNPSEGIGLFRSEYLFLENKHIIASEEKQYRAYVELLDAMKGLPVVIRAFDIGGDKTFSTENLGCRGIRFLLAHRELFTLQLRALLRAGLHGDLSLLLPLVADVGELILSKQLLQEAALALHKEGIACKDSLPIGCMIELPSAVMSCDILLKQCDFFSIGTNDLVQYTFGIDRNQITEEELYYPAHPSLIRMLSRVILEAKKQGKPVTLCGEIASNPLFAPLLLGLGFERLSCAPRAILAVKRALRKTTLLRAKLLAEKVLQLGSIDEVMEALRRH